MTFEAEQWVVRGFPCFLFVPLRFPRVIYSKEDFAVVKITQNPSRENPQVPGPTSLESQTHLPGVCQPTHYKAHRCFHCEVKGPFLVEHWYSFFPIKAALTLLRSL